jgi:hypothetical protein
MIAWEDAITVCHDIRAMIEELPERAESFGAGVLAKVEDLEEWISTHKHCTPKMEIALENMQLGLERWLE